MSPIFRILLIVSVLLISGCVEFNKLTSKVGEVTSESVEDITQGLEIKSIEGIADKEGIITKLDIWVVNKAGSSSTDLRDIVIHMSDETGYYDLRFDNTTSSFSARAILDKKMIFNEENPILEKGDIIAITIDAKKLGMQLGSGSIFSMSFISSKGNIAGSKEIEIGSLKYGTNKILP